MIENLKNRRIAIARITGLPDREGRYPVSLGGDGLSSLKSPFPAELYRPDYFGTDLKQILKTARQGPNPDGLFYPIEVRSVRLQSKKARICLEFSSRGQTKILQAVSAGEDIRTASDMETAGLDLSGLWICVRSSLLSQSLKEDEYFVYELLGLPVFQNSAKEVVGEVTDFLETGAHGVIEVTLSATQEAVLIPMIREYVSFAEGRSALLIPRLDEFLGL